MAKKLMSFKTKGMNRDLSVSAFNPEFSFENKNLRLNTTDSNTLLSWVNEKGTERIKTSEGQNIKLEGTPIGTAVINSKLVVFTTGNNTEEKATSGKDYIYILTFNDDNQTMTCKLFFNGNLNFSTKYPLETLVSYEAEHIQKIYWTDNRNQPRLVNIASDKELNDYSFDFVPVVDLNEKITVTKKNSGGGIFAPGVIQYAFTYINKHRQQSNIIYTTPLYYLNHKNSGASPESKVSCSFNIKIENADKNFEYIRIYSIQRTSLNSDVIVKYLDDIPTDSKTEGEEFKVQLKYTDLNDSTITLPVNNEGKILTSIATGGSYNIYIYPMFTLKTFKNNSKVNIVGYNQNAEQSEVIMSFQNFITKLYNKELPNYNDNDLINTDYYSYIELNQNLYDVIKGIANNAIYEKWALSIDGTLYFGHEKYDFQGCTFIYNFYDTTWYITSTSAKDSIRETVNRSSSGGDFITYIDNGNTGSTIDPYELLFVGGKEIKTLSFSDKDGTLFMGNITQTNSSIKEIQKHFDNIRNKEDAVNVSFYNDGKYKAFTLDHAYGIYQNTNMLNWNQSQITTFKGGETYRLGFQLQKNTGEWSEPIYIDDVYNDKYPSTNIINDNINLVYAQADIPNSEILDYKNIRPVIVYPNIGDRTVLCQGVLNPTVFNASDRIDNSPYSQASWFFRPYTSNKIDAYIPEYSKDINVDFNILKDGENVNLAPDDSYFTDNPLLKEVAVLTAFVDPAYINNILKRGKLAYRYVDKYDNPADPQGYRNIDEIRYDDFWGAINLDSSSNHWAFLSGAWKDYSIIDEYGEQRYTHEGIEGVSAVRIGSKKFNIYKNLSTSNLTHLCYYTKPEGGPDTYDFKFTAGGYYYKVTFPAVNTEQDYNPTDDNIGSNLAFTHYDTLKLEGKEEEIQGTIHRYDSAFSAKQSMSSETSNNQFFIDQSIITLNSPDIEFDSTVQTYGLENLHLRIIGAIPITSYISHHKITTGSAMLETWHNNSSSTEGNKYFGTGEKNLNIVHNNISLYGGNRLVAEYLWHDTAVFEDEGKEDKIKTKGYYNFMVYPWQRTGSLNNDFRTKDKTSSLLKTKKISHLLYSINTSYFSSKANIDSVIYNSIGTLISLTENDHVHNIKIPKQKGALSDINYYPNIDKLLYNSNGYGILSSEGNDDFKLVTDPVLMRYKSTSHAVIALNSTDGKKIPILPFGSFINGENNIVTGVYTHSKDTFDTFWGDKDMQFIQNKITMTEVFDGYSLDYLWLAELYKDVDNTTRFGGKSETALQQNNWQIAGEPQKISKENDKTTIVWTVGDTYYQRYDCLKTYPFTFEDENQNIEILSFMCETHVNIDGRYDKNRGQTDNTSMNPTNFNLINPVYNQQDNYFISKKSQEYLEFPNQITWSKTKTSGSDVDLWTNITLANTLELDGDKGSISKLDKLNDQLLCFQDNGLSHILYNERVQISTADGVPIELANSDKVQGKKYISDTIGCSNKWSIVNTPGGIYFMDSNDKSIYLYNGELTNISLKGGMNSWCKQKIKSGSIKWNPDEFKTFVSYYDSINQDVMFIDSSTALSWNENFGTFTSFYDYGDTPYFNNLQDVGIWIRKDGSIWRHQAGDYCKFFDSDKPFWMTLIGNVEPTTDKTFTNLEFRVTVEGEGSYNPITDKFTPTLPFSSLETWNDYQHGYTDLSFKLGSSGFKHHDKNMSSLLKRKFRMWRCDIPRNNAELDKDRKPDSQYLYSKDSELGISRHIKKPLDRMRNPWLYLKLYNTAINQSKVEIHDIMMTYFN